MLFVVTGIPRSGTRYASRLMTALGLPCDHEKVLRPCTPVVNVARWPTLGIGEASWMAWSQLPLMVGHRVPVLHALRNPWDVIDSLANRNQIVNPMASNKSSLQSVRELIDAYLPDVFARPQRVDRAAAFALGWHELIVRHVPHRFMFHIDRLDRRTVRQMVGYLGADVDAATIDKALEDVSTSTNEGYTLDGIPGVSDPDVARWIAQYAKEQDCRSISTCRIRDEAARQTPEELIAEMDPELVDRVNEYADSFGYPVYELVA